MPDRLMSDAEIIRRLRLVASQKRGHRMLPMSAIAARCNMSRMALYKVLHGVLMSEGIRIRLSPVLAEIPLAELLAAEAAGPGWDGVR